MARAGRVPVTPLVRESAAALITLADDPMDLLMSCRRLLDRRPSCAPLVWLAARMLTSPDPCSEARDAVAEIESDPTGYELDHALGHGLTVLVPGESGIVGEWGIVGPVLHSRSDLQVLLHDPAASVPAVGSSLVGAGRLVVLESDCLGPDRALVPPGSLTLTSWARNTSTPVWLVAGVGRFMPKPIWEQFVTRFSSDRVGGLGFEVIDIEGLVDRVVTPVGLRTPDEARRRTDCPAVTELFPTNRNAMLPIGYTRPA